MKFSFVGFQLNHQNSHAEFFNFIAACSGGICCTIVVSEKVRHILFCEVIEAKTTTFQRPFENLEFDRFWSLEEIYDFMDELEATYPGFAEVEHMGISEQGRQIRGLRLTNEEHLGQEALHVMFVTAGKVARDWITVMAANNLMLQLLSNYEENRAIVGNI